MTKKMALWDNVQRLGHWCAEIKQRMQANRSQPSLALRGACVALADLGFCFVLGAILILWSRLKKYTQISKLPLLLKNRKAWPLPGRAPCTATQAICRSDSSGPPWARCGALSWGTPQLPSFTHFLSSLAVMSIHLLSPEEATRSNTSVPARAWAAQCFTSPSIMNQVDVNFLSI